MENALAKLISGQQNMLFVGVGNVLKKDDGVGVFIGQHMAKRKNVDVLIVEVSIENYIGKINALDPECLILIDCVDFGQKPGSFSLIDLEDIRDLTTNTHNISLGKMKDLFNAKDIKVLGVQPADVNFGEGLTKEVEKAAQRILEMVNQEE